MLRLMLADDEQFERDYLEKVVKESYPTLLKIVCKAADGVEFMEKLEACNPQIVLLDVKMPRMDGLETAKRILEKYPDVQIIIVSAYGDFAYAKQAMKLGISEYLLKPYLDSELREVLDRVIVRIRDREENLAMLSCSNSKDKWTLENVMEDSAKDFLWNVVFRRKSIGEVGLLTDSKEKKWLKVVVISCQALSPMGSFSQEVMDNYFRTEGVTVWSSIWMNQMLVCMLSDRKEAFSEMNGCIRRAKNYLAEEHHILVACGVSGTYEGVECLPAAYDEAAAFIRDFSETEMSCRFAETTETLKQLCLLEEQLIKSLTEREKETSENHFNELLERLEQGLEYQDVAVKLNFGRSLRTVIHGINGMPGYCVSDPEIMIHFGLLEELNFNGDSLWDHLERFAAMVVEKQ